MARGRTLGRVGRRIALYVTVAAVCFVVSFPILWALLSSFKTKQEMFAVPLRPIPSALTLSHYAGLWSTTEIPRLFANSFVVALGTAAVTVVVAALGAYSLTRFPFPGRAHIARGILVCYMLPPILLTIPLFVLFKHLGIVNTRVGLVFAHVASVLPFVIWLLWGFFRTIPPEIEEAAKIDGAGRLRVLLTVFVPLALPGLAAAVTFSFIVSWADYLFSSVMVTKEEVMTLPVGIAFMSARDYLRWDTILASMGVITIPVIAVVLFFQRYLLHGFSAPSSR
jgi:multiple sugar transport system permease protein